jgi:hypothetical protein
MAGRRPDEEGDGIAARRNRIITCRMLIWYPEDRSLHRVCKPQLRPT